MAFRPSRSLPCFKLYDQNLACSPSNSSPYRSCGHTGPRSMIGHPILERVWPRSTCTPSCLNGRGMLPASNRFDPCHGRQCHLSTCTIRLFPHPFIFVVVLRRPLNPLNPPHPRLTCAKSGKSHPFYSQGVPQQSRESICIRNSLRWKDGRVEGWKGPR